MNTIIKDIALGVVRNAAAAGGAWLVAHGVTNADGAQGFIGSVCFLAALGFTAYDKLVRQRQIGTALATPVPSTTGN